MRSSSGALATISAKKSQALIAFLAAKPGQRVSRDKVALLLWSSTGPEQARQSLRQTLSTLRKELSQISPDSRILVEENDLLGVDENVLEVDVVTFESLVASGLESALDEATRLYRGDFLDGFYINEDRFDQWVLGERDRLHRMALRAHMHLIDLQSRRGATDDAIITAQKSLRIDMLQEPVHRALMRLYMQSGDLVHALQQYETCAKVLKRELRVDPDAETKSLHREILAVRSRATMAGPAAGDEPEQGRKKSILVVEDNVLSRELTNALLKSAGYAVIQGRRRGAHDDRPRACRPRPTRRRPPLHRRPQPPPGHPRERHRSSRHLHLRPPRRRSGSARLRSRRRRLHPQAGEELRPPGARSEGAARSRLTAPVAYAAERRTRLAYGGVGVFTDAYPLI